MKSILKLKNLYVLGTLIFLSYQSVTGQNFLYTKGNNNVAIISMGATSSAQCTVVEYPDFLVVNEIPYIPIKADSSKNNPLITFIDSIYLNKPIKYVLNSHSHGHSLSTILPFLEKGAKLVTAAENIEIYTKRGFFESEDYTNAIIAVSSDTVLLSETQNPIKVIHLKKSDYRSIPTKAFLFFYFSQQKLLSASCMIYLRDLNEKYGYKGLMYSDRLLDVNKILIDKNLNPENTLQLYRLREANGVSIPPIFPISYFQNVLKHSWHRKELSEHFQNMPYEILSTKKDSLLSFLIETDIYHIVLNHAIYELIKKAEYQKAVALAQILVLYEPNIINEIDTLGEAYFNNGQIHMAKHYDDIIRRSGEKPEGTGLTAWESNQKERLGTP